MKVQIKLKTLLLFEGPDAVLNSSEENNPIITDSKPPIIENNTIFFGLSDTFSQLSQIENAVAFEI